MREFEALSDNTQLVQYINNFEQKIKENRESFLWKKYEPIIQANVIDENLFLSVVVRTQGKREDGLREALLCLQAQRNQDFEILLMGHRVNAENKKVIENILNNQDEMFRKKIRYFEIEEVGRAVPLNYALANARGKYIAIYDDDDILFDEWTETFYNLAEKNDGRILHAFAFSQTWKNLGELGYEATGAPIANYCVDFNFVNQLTVNRCPLMTLAFPTIMAKQYGFFFREDLHVTEDWEFFMRLAFICGVSDSNNPVAIYRYWENSESSATLHSQEFWDNTYKDIQCSFFSEDRLMPKASIQQIIAVFNKQNQRNNKDTSAVLPSRFYYSCGSAFSDQMCIYTYSASQLPQFDLWFLFQEKRNDLKAMRFDFAEYGLFIINDLKITVWFTNGEKYELSENDIVHNGINYKRGILFLHEDPEIVWEWNDVRNVDVVHVEGTIKQQLERTKKLAFIERFASRKNRDKKKRLSELGLF